MHDHKRIRLAPPIAGDKFDTIPTFGKALDEMEYKPYLVKSDQQVRAKIEQGAKIMRYAAYIRVSDEEQLKGYSLDAQRRIITEWVASKGGSLVKVYAEEGESATTADRTQFQQLRLDARRGNFDAVVVHKFDRFARNRYDALAIKSLFRYDFKIKVFSVTEPSEDSDGPIGALIEGIMECVADWYSRNLATEVKKSKKERTQQGFHNNQAPFGMTKDEEKRLIPDPNELPGLILAFETYAAGHHSDADIANLLNEEGYRTKNGRPFSKDTVRDMLQNQVYLGMVKYQEYQKRMDRKRERSVPTAWFDGQHEAVITQELFDRAMAARRSRVAHRQATPRYNPYLLRNLVYCYRCCLNAPTDYTFPAFGRMRAQAQTKGANRYYRCRAKDFDHACSQKAVRCEVIEAQVVSALMNLKPPADWRNRITEAMGALLGEQNLETRLAEIRETIERMDFRWDHGFITDKAEYLQSRVQLQQELEQLKPIPDDDLERAADMLANFQHYWEGCNDDPEAQHNLIKLIVDRVYVEDENVVAMTLKADYHVVLGHNANESATVDADSGVYTCGADGFRTRDLCLDRAVC